MQKRELIKCKVERRKGKLFFAGVCSDKTGFRFVLSQVSKARPEAPGCSIYIVQKSGLIQCRVEP